jgi:hypothetical protein
VISSNFEFCALLQSRIFFLESVHILIFEFRSLRSIRRCFGFFVLNVARLVIFERARQISMAEARAAVNTLRVGTLSLEQVTSAAKLRGVQVVESRFAIGFLDDIKEIIVAHHR